MNNRKEEIRRREIDKKRLERKIVNLVRKKERTDEM